MAYWRMQLHPARPGESLKHCIESLAACYVGLDFSAEVGDLKETTREKLPERQKPYWGFAHDMEPGDTVLVIAHHFPFALATVEGDYNYVRQVAPEIGVWFRHFRKVRDVHYYGDIQTNARKWDQLKMTETIAHLRDPETASYKLIETWLRRIEALRIP